MCFTEKTNFVNELIPAQHGRLKRVPQIFFSGIRDKLAPT